MELYFRGKTSFFSKVLYCSSVVKFDKPKIYKANNSFFITT